MKRKIFGRKNSFPLNRLGIYVTETVVCDGDRRILADARRNCLIEYRRRWVCGRNVKTAVLTNEGYDVLTAMRKD